MFRSIRWTLQLWHAGILIAAVTGIGLAGYLQISSSRYKEIDSELEAGAQALTMQVKPTPPQRFRDGRPYGRPPGGFDGNDSMAGSVGDDPMNLGPGFGPEGNGGGRQRSRGGNMGRGGLDDDPGAAAAAVNPEDRIPSKIDIPTDLISRYHGTDAEARSFVLWHGNKILGTGGSALVESDLPIGTLPEPGQTQLYQLGNYHEVIAGGPFHTFAMVRTSISPVEQELRHLVSTLAITGVSIVAFGLIGGWLVSLRAVRPIRTMTRTAESLSATNLSGRIDVRTVPSELRKLTKVLNGAFARLELSFDRQVRFTADASHELRTPLAVIHSNAELALSRDRSAEEYRKTIEACFAAAKRMRNLTDSLLLLAHADAGELAMEVEHFDLSEVILDGVDLLDAAAVAASVTVTTQIRPLVAVGDPIRMGQVVVNLVGNAIRYNKPGGTVTVTADQDNDSLVLKVTDTGVGISAEELPRVFDRFYRADKARTRVAGGSGLGTAICKSIVEAHGGTITVQSTIDVGSTFTVRLPKPPAGGSIDALPSESPARKSGKPIKLLH